AGAVRAGRPFPDIEAEPLYDLVERASGRAFWIAFGALSIAFHIGLVFSGLVPNLVTRPLHMALALPWIFVYPARTLAARRTGVMLTAVGVACCLYVALDHDRLGDQYGFLDGALQTAIAVALLATALEMARRAIGWPLPAVAALALAYGLLGQHLPG